MTKHVITERYLVQVDPSRRLPPAHSTRIQQFRTRREAEQGARAIGWSACDAIAVDVMGFRVWAIMDPHGFTVTRDGFVFWSAR